PDLAAEVSLTISRSAGQDDRNRISRSLIKAAQQEVLHWMFKLDGRDLLTTSRALDRFVVHIVIAGNWTVVTKKTKPFHACSIGGGVSVTRSRYFAAMLGFERSSASSSGLVQQSIQNNFFDRMLSIYSVKSFVTPGMATNRKPAAECRSTVSRMSVTFPLPTLRMDVLH